MPTCTHGRGRGHGGQTCPPGPEVAAWLMAATTGRPIMEHMARAGPKPPPRRATDRDADKNIPLLFLMGTCLQPRSAQE